jgi:hypothetical protein
MGAEENMDSNLEQERQQAHVYLDLLPSEKLSAILGLLETMLSPVARSITHAPIEDEEIGADEERDVSDAREWFKHNKGIPHEEVLAEFGLTLEDFEKMSSVGGAAIPGCSRLQPAHFPKLEQRAD